MRESLRSDSGTLLFDHCRCTASDKKSNPHRCMTFNVHTTCMCKISEAKKTIIQDDNYHINIHNYQELLSQTH